MNDVSTTECLVPLSFQCVFTTDLTLNGSSDLLVIDLLVFLIYSFFFFLLMFSRKFFIFFLLNFSIFKKFPSIFRSFLSLLFFPQLFFLSFFLSFLFGHCNKLLLHYLVLSQLSLVNTKISHWSVQVVSASSKHFRLTGMNVGIAESFRLVERVLSWINDVYSNFIKWRPSGASNRIITTGLQIRASHVRAIIHRRSIKSSRIVGRNHNWIVRVYLVMICWSGDTWLPTRS